MHTANLCSENLLLRFSGYTVSFSRCSIGVFFCGPKVLSSQLHKMCNKHSDITKRTTFSYNKENF